MRRALLCVLGVLALGRCSGGASPPTADTNSPTVDAGTTPPSADAGTTPPSADAGTTPPAADAGTTPPGSGGTPDAGTPGGTNPGADAGAPGGNDAGTSGDADAGAAGGSDGGTATDAGSAATFPASEDPQFVVVRSSAAACSGVGPQGDPGTPTRVLRAFPSSYWWCATSRWADFATSDGQGDVAFSCESAEPEEGWNEVYSRDGTVHTRINSWGLVTALSDGFAASYIPYGNYKADLTFTWFDGAWHSAGYSDTPDAARGLVAHAWRPVLVQRRSDRTTQWHDEHGNPLRPAVTWPDDPPVAFGVDSLGHALIGQNTSGTAEGEIIAKWVDADDQTVGHPFSWRDSPGGMSEHVIGGGLLFNRTTYVPSGGLPQPAPAWFATHAERMMVVNGARAYAFARPDDGSCSPTVTLFAPDGTECGSISLIGRDSSCPQPAAVGVDGSLIQSIPTTVQDPNGYAYTIWRWWPAYLLR